MVTADVQKRLFEPADPAYADFQARLTPTVDRERFIGVRVPNVRILAKVNHGENMKVPDFRIKAERDTVRDDDLTPFPDENCQGATLPCAMPYNG